MAQNTFHKTPQVERLYLDFDSFFATAEQHFNPSLRGRPVGVVPLDSPHSGCIAVSREAKRRGVKSSASIKDARAIIPDMIFVVARHDVYVRLHNRILNVIEAVVPVAHVRSVDEVVCHLLPSEAAQSVALAGRIKQALAQSFSPTLTCSIGLAPTELLAKIGAEYNKPDGCVTINIADMPRQLIDMDLTDLPGVSGGMEARLNAAGVHDFAGLWNLAPKQARAIWGSVEGERFWNELHGFHAPKAATLKRMFGHSRMLPRAWRTPDKVRDCARQLTASASRRLRRTEFRAAKLTLGLRGEKLRNNTASNGTSQKWGWEAHFAPSRDDRTFLQALSQGLDKAETHMRFAPRSVGVFLHGLVDQSSFTGDLFENEEGRIGGKSVIQQRQQWENVSDLMDQLRAKHGPAAINLGAHDEVPGGYLGAKIAFGRIPEEGDFDSAPVADEATHFCTF